MTESLKINFLTFSLHFLLMSMTFSVFRHNLLEHRSIMAQFDDDILRCLFNKRYMDFETCSSLRSVSARFNFFAAKYCHSIKELDLCHLTKPFNQNSESVGEFYPCLIEAMAKCYPNVQKVTGVRIIIENLNLASQKFLEGLPYLTSVALDGYSIEMAILFPFLKRLPHLRSVKLQRIENYRNRVANVPEEKLTVWELSLKSGQFWRIFRVDRLRKLVGLSVSFRDEEERGEFSAVLARCQNLEQLELKLNIHNFNLTYFPSLMRGLEDRLKKLAVKFECFGPESVYWSMREFPFVWQRMKILEMLSSEPAGG